jgi:RES domain
VPLDRTWLEQIPVHRIAVRIYYRHVWLPPVGAPDPFYVRPGEGRWATDWTLYTAEEEAVTWAEYCRNHPDDVRDADITGGAGLDLPGLEALAADEVPVAARSLYELDCVFDRLADLMSPWARVCLENAGFDNAGLLADDYGQCPELAAWADDLRWEGLRSPSAAWIGGAGCVSIFLPGRAKIRAVRQAIPAARPSVAVAYATRYRARERPVWLR